MRAIERAAVARILIDLIKADKVIDSREMDLYRQLKSKYSISQKDEVEAYSLTLSKAINVLKEMEASDVAELLQVFEKMTMSDAFCAREEALLLLALSLCLREDDPECDIISTVIEEPWFDERQVLYIESHHAKDVNFSIQKDLRAISRELKLCGLEFVYLPRILHHYITTPKTLLMDVVSMLSPSLSQSAVAGLLTKIKLFKTDTFCIEQLHHKLGFTELADTPPALLMRVSQSKVGNEVFTNFLRVELNADVLATIQNIVDMFLSYNGSDRIIVSHKKDEKGSFLYNGFYRQIFEILLLQKSIECHLLVDFIHGKISFPEIDITLSGIHRKEKALYTLFIYEAGHDAFFNEDGNIIQNGGINFTPPSNPKQLAKFNRRMELLQRKYAKIYAAFGGEEETAPDISRADIRLPMLAVIKRVISKHSEKIYDVNRFIIQNPERKGIYSLSAIPETFQCIDFHSSQPISIYDSTLFKELDEMS